MGDHPRFSTGSPAWRAFERLDRGVFILGWAGVVLAGLLVGFLFLLLIVSAISRPWSNFVFGFAYELGSVMMWPIAFLPLAAVWRAQGHVRFDLFLRLTRRRQHHVLELLGSIAALIVGVLFVWQGWVSLTSHYARGTSTLVFRYEVWPVYGTVLAGSAILLLELMSSVARETREVIAPSGFEDDRYGWSAPGV